MDMKKTLKTMNDIVEVLGDVCELVGKVAGKMEESRMQSINDNNIDFDEIEN